MTKQKLGLMALCLCMALGGSPDAFGAPASEKTEAAEAAGAVAPEAAASLVEVQAALDADNAEKAVELLKPLVKKKQPEAMYVMGRLALEGRGTRRSPAKGRPIPQNSRVPPVCRTGPTGSSLRRRAVAAKSRKRPRELP